MELRNTVKQPLRVPRDIRQNAIGLGAKVAMLAAVSYLNPRVFGNMLGMSLVFAPWIALGFYRLTRGLLDREPVLHIDDCGILDRRLKLGLIPWERISTMQRTGRGVRIGLGDPVHFGLEHTFWSRLNKDFGAPRDTYELLIRVHGLLADAKRVEERLLAEATDRGITKLP